MPGASQRYGLNRALLLVVLPIVAAAVVAGTGELAVHHFHSRDRERALQQLDAEAQAGARSVALLVERTLEAVNTLHVWGHVLKAELNRDHSPDRSFVQDHVRGVVAGARLPALQFALIDANGVLRWSTVPNYVAVDLSDREHFRVHRDGRHRPFISKPLVGRASGRWSVELTRPLLDASSEFDGVAVVSIDPFILSRELATLWPATEALVKIFREDGTLVASNMEENLPGRSVGAELHELASQSGLPAGNAYAPALVRGDTGEIMATAVAGVGDWPVFVSYGVDPRFHLHEAQRRRSSMRVAVAIAVSLCFVAYVLLVALYKGRVAKRAAASAEGARRELQGLLDGLPAAVYTGLLSQAERLQNLQISSGLSNLLDGRRLGARLDDEQELLDLWREARPMEYLHQLRVDGEATAEYAMELPNGSSRWIRDQARIVGRHSSDLVEIVGIVSDITDERGAKAEAVAAAKLATLGEMATGIVHELSQPCAAIALTADVASHRIEHLDRDPGQKQHLARALQEIAEQTVRMRQVMDHFRIFAQRDEPAVGDVDIEEAVQGALSIVRGNLLAVSIRVELDIPPGLPPVKGRLVPMEQVLVNLLVNARDAMEQIPDDQRVIRIRAQLDPEAHNVVLKVKDNGSGFTPAQLAHAFEPFFTSKPVGRGMGLGLSISYRTLEQAEGRIAIANHRDGGAEVTLTLSIAAASK